MHIASWSAAAFATALAATLACGFGVPPARAAEHAPARKIVHAASLEALSPAQDGGRYRVRAALHAAPTRATPDAAPQLRATLAPLAKAALCAPGDAIFRDGFESP